ncbi:MAG: aspartate kinase [Legionella sp.]|nr:aspartate kinase [Legionella sp.]
MALLVQKFGGSSLATIQHINQAADIIAKAKQAGHHLVVIVSAMGGETDRLINLAADMSESPDAREYAALVSTGEQVSMALMAMALINRGIPARSYTGGQARIHTCSQFKKARIHAIDTQPILDDLKQGNVVVVAGFQGIDKAGNITTLGRGGSDTTAVAIAAALNADECQIYTDVEGVYTSDPRVVPDARRLDQISFDEMLELSSLGAKVLQIRAVEFAGKYRMPLRVLSSAQEGPGTLITYSQTASMEAPLVTGIAFSRQEAKITVTGIPDTPGVTSAILAEINALGSNIDMIAQRVLSHSQTELTFTVPRAEYEEMMRGLQKIVKTFGNYVLVGEVDLAKVSLVGAGLRSHPEVVSNMLETLASKNIGTQLITTSEIKISLLIASSMLEESLRALHDVFCLNREYTEESENSFSASMMTNDEGKLTQRFV